MRTRRIVVGAFAGLLLAQWNVQTNACVASASEDAMEKQYEDWFDVSGEVTYPITPDSEEWVDLTYLERREACQAPQELLETLSDYEVVNLAITYPLQTEAFIYSTYEDGVEHLISVSNVFEELFSREDISEALITAYAENEVDYSQITNETVDDGESYLQERVIEVLLAYQWNAGELDNDQKNSVVDLQKEKNELHKTQDPEASGLFFFYDVLFENEEIPVVITPAATSTEGFIAGGSGYTIYSAYFTGGIYYKYGTSASCYRYDSNDMSSSEKSIANASFANTYPDLVYKSTATYKYNCHSYCWISNTYTNIYWLNNPSNFMNATSYFTSHSANSAISKGDYIVIYDSNGIAHSLIAQTASSGSSATSRMTTTTVISKFGTYGVYESTLKDAYDMYDGTYYKVYTPK